MNLLKLRSLLEQFYIEDIGDRDLSSEYIFGKNQLGQVSFICKENGVFCGEDIIQNGFRLIDEEIKVSCLVQDGETVEVGQTLAVITGPVHYLLMAERVVLNLIQRMSGIATATNAAVNMLQSSTTRICDTRKTTPGLRMLDKHAVKAGGGYNHRFGLYDAVMLKDNHIAFAGSILEAVKKIKAEVGHMVKIEVETETLEQVKEAVEAGVDVIMFDNQTPDRIKEWIEHVPNHIVTEASGGITIENLASYGDTGVNYISLGYLTHSVKALDISAKVLV